MSLPYELYTVKQIRVIEETALKSVSEFDLMTRAGQAAFRLLIEKYPDIDSMNVFCGGGNNGGDGFVVAKLAHDAGLDVSVYHLGEKSNYSDAAAQALSAIEALDIPLAPFSSDMMIEEAAVSVDALLGIGLESNVHGLYLEAIEYLNDTESLVLSLDLPSGINGDNGQVMGAAVYADMTVTFIGVKLGLVSGEALAYVGDLHCDNLVVEEALEAHALNALRVDEFDIAELLPKREVTAHKGELGHVLVIGGDRGMAGAVRMSAEAALRVGAGKVSVLTHLAHHPVILNGRPELMCLPVESASEAATFLPLVDVIVLGPGLSASQWSKEMLDLGLSFSGPKVIDAGALTLVAEQSLTVTQAVLTPHPGEAGRLLGVSASDIQADRYRAVIDLVKAYQAVTVLKGAGTIIQPLDDVPYVCTLGNPGMASAGMGDVLAGMIAGFIAQGVALAEAATLATVLHAYAGDLAVKKQGVYGLLASDLYHYIAKGINEMKEVMLDDDIFSELNKES